MCPPLHLCMSSIAAFKFFRLTTMFPSGSGCWKYGLLLAETLLGRELLLPSLAQQSESVPSFRAVANFEGSKLARLGVSGPSGAGNEELLSPKVSQDGCSDSPRGASGIECCWAFGVFHDGFPLNFALGCLEELF